MSNGYTIRLHVPAGEPEGVVVIEQPNWTGRCVVIPRAKLAAADARPELGHVGVYMLAGRSEGDEDGMPALFIGQSEDLRAKLAAHAAELEFWDHAVFFVSMGHYLNRGHLLWIENELARRIRALGRARLVNDTIAPEPHISEFDRADAKAFFDEMARLAPFAGIRALEEPVAVTAPRARPGDALESRGEHADTLVLAATPDQFRKLLQNEQRWPGLRLAGGLLAHLRFVAVFQTAPVSAVTHWAPIDRVVRTGDGGHYQVHLSEAPQAMGAIQLGRLTASALHAPRPVRMADLRKAKSLADLFAPEAEPLPAAAE